MYSIIYSIFTFCVRVMMSYMRAVHSDSDMEVKPILCAMMMIFLA